MDGSKLTGTIPIRMKTVPQIVLYICYRTNLVTYELQCIYCSVLVCLQGEGEEGVEKHSALPELHTG